MNEAEDALWMEGNRAAYRHMFQTCAQALGEKSDLTALQIERGRAIAALRDACREFGDNDWPDNLDLSDIIEKHLVRHLGD